MNTSTNLSTNTTKQGLLDACQNLALAYSRLARVRSGTQLETPEAAQHAVTLAERDLERLIETSVSNPVPNLPTYQLGLKRHAAKFYGCTVQQMDLPYEAWAVLRDKFLTSIGQIK